MEKIVKQIDKILYLFYRKKHMLVGFALGWLTFVVVNYDIRLKLMVNLSIISLVLGFYCFVDIFYRGVKK